MHPFLPKILKTAAIVLLILTIGLLIGIFSVIFYWQSNQTVLKQLIILFSVSLALSFIFAIWSYLYRMISTKK